MEVVRSLANQIKGDYKGCRPVIVCVLKGANPVRLMTKFKIIELARYVPRDYIPILILIFNFLFRAWQLSNSRLGRFGVSSTSTYWMRCKTVGKGFIWSLSEFHLTKERSQLAMLKLQVG